MDITVIVRTLTPLADTFEFYAIPYHLTGSLATSVYVKAHAVQGIEVVSDIKFSQVPALVVQLENTYDVKEIALRSRAFSVASPEDTILTLLERYNGGVQRFQRLWESIVEILVMRGSTLDLAYLRLWATSLDVALLLEQALATTGVSDA